MNYLKHLEKYFQSLHIFHTSYKKRYFSKRTRIFLRIFYIGLFIYLLLFIFAAKLEGYLIFPGVYVNTLQYTKDTVNTQNLNIETIDTTQNGENIHGWYIDNHAKKTVYYFHGNGGSLFYFQNEIKFISDLGYNVLAIEYPGYGDTDGFPYEKDINKDAEALFHYAQKTYGLIEQDTIVWGYSIGTGIATEFAKGRPIDALILLAAYTSRYDLSRFHYNFAVQKLFFLPNSFVTEENISQVIAPIYIAHGTDDTLVDYNQGKKLYEIAPGIKYFESIPGGDHFHFFETQKSQEDISLFLQYHTLDRGEIEKIEKEKQRVETDFTSDSSYQKYVDPDFPFQKLGYTPDDMRKLHRTYVGDTKGDAQLRDEAATQFEKLAEAFYTAMGEKVIVVSSYRSYNYQVGIKAGGCPDNLCAKAGYSEHQSGLALDLWSASSDTYWKSSPRLMKYYAWLDENAYKYGFTNSYKNGKDIDGYEIEPWHWRYLGVDLATYLHEQNITFAHYFYLQKKEQ